MAEQDATTLKGYFNTGDTPTEAQFAELIDTIFGDSRFAAAFLAYVAGLTEDSTPTSDAVLAYLNDVGGTPTVRSISVPQLNNGVLLHDETLASTGTFDVSSISQDYDDLIILARLRSDAASGSDGAYIYFNNDTTNTNYHRELQYHNNGSASVVEGALPIFTTSGADAPTNSFGEAMFHISDYAGTDYLKQAYYRGHVLSGAGVIWVLHGSIVWEDGGATAINRISLVTDNDPTNVFVAGSRLRIVGIKYA